MDEAQVREHAEAHAKSIERGDVAAITSDFIPDLHPQVPAIVNSLPSPLKTAEVLSVDVQDDRAFVEIRYSGDDQSVTIRSTWEDRGGQPLIVAGEPVG
jgi:hypothetical protein